MDVAGLKAEADRLFEVHRALIAEAGALAAGSMATVTAGYQRLAEAASAVAQAGAAWSAAREARGRMPGNPTLAAAADLAEEAFFAADATHRDVVLEVTPAQERALALASADAVATKAANLAFRAAQDAYFSALARQSA